MQKEQKYSKGFYSVLFQFIVLMIMSGAIRAETLADEQANTVRLIR